MISQMNSGEKTCHECPRCGVLCYCPGEVLDAETGLIACECLCWLEDEGSDEDDPGSDRSLYRHFRDDPGSDRKRGEE